MRNYAKVGNRRGRPAYRTPALFRYRKYQEVIERKVDIYDKRTAMHRHYY